MRKDSIEGESGLQTTLGIILERYFYDTLYWVFTNESLSNGNTPNRIMMIMSL